MKTVTIPDLDAFDEEYAEDCIHRAFDPSTGEFSAIHVDQLDEPNLNRGAARALAVRLLALADTWDREEFEREYPHHAATRVTLDRGEPGQPDVVALLNDANDVTHRMNAESARQMALALSNLADTVDETRRPPLRRLPRVDDQLRELDD